MRIIKKTWKLLACLCLTLASLQITNIHAASFSIGASTGSVDAGGSFTVSVTLDGAGLFGFSASNGTVSTSSQFCDGSCSVSATAGSSGTTTITVSALDATGYDESPITGSQSVNVTIHASGGNSGGTTSGSSSGGSVSGGTTNTDNNTQAPIENKSADNALSSLVVSKGTLDPAFDSAVMEYRMTLAADVTSVTVDATANDSKASVSGTGEVSVKPGDNRLEIVVTAEDGGSRTYVINAYVDEKPDMFMKVNGKEYGVVPNVDDVVIPAGFEKTVMNFEGKEIPAWKHTSSGIMLVYLLNEKSEKNFYIIENNAVTSIYKPMSLLGYNVAVIDIPEDIQKRKGMTFTEVEVDSQKLPGWSFDEEAFANFSLIYVMNEKGEKVYFQYEKTSNTLQPYSQAAAVTQEDYEHQSTMLLVAEITAGVMGVVAAIFFGMWLTSLRKRKKSGSDGAEPQRKIIEREEPVQQSAMPVKKEINSQRPAYHRQPAPVRKEPRRSEGNALPEQDVDFGTQPFRFHDDFDDDDLK